jgi:hypothetical protein
LLAAEKSVEFFKIIRTYQIAIIRENQLSSSGIISTTSAATLQGVTQDQIKNESFNQNKQSNKNKSRDNFINSKKNEKCICEEEHFFKKCLYIVKLNRKRR